MLEILFYERQQAIADRQSRLPNDVTGIEFVADFLDDDADFGLTVVQGPECRLLAAIMRYFAVVNAQRAELRNRKQLGSDDRTSVHQPQCRIQTANVLQGVFAMNVAEKLNPVSDGAGQPSSFQHGGRS